ncbi:hypothetical protein [Corynebacterium oculi]|uniref:hypothetical protein n=1 Tax=Corynebacterium oculi TaxID=1544416 RepID=UPI00123776EF|nr:hypothetical protein [Corynebacterium oculi]
MTDLRRWIHATTGIRVTADEVGGALGISRASATRRLVANEFNASEIITLCRAFGVNPLQGLLKYRYLTDLEIRAHVKREGELMKDVENGALAIELARRLNPTSRAGEITNLVKGSTSKYDPPIPAAISLENARDQRNRTSGGTQITPVVPEELYAADHSPDEDELRWEHGEEPID